ncbi:MAG TPA: hypothetical protein VGK37_17010 [Casimicrobiaceae bacterium]|jgi:hypothetical protein
MSWQTPLWTCGRADWVGAYDDASDARDAGETRASAKPDLAVAEENAARKAKTQEVKPVSP